MTPIAPISAPSCWLAEHVAAVGAQPPSLIPTLAPGSMPPALPGIDLWDLWPLQLADGSTARFGGASLWFVLCAPALPDPEERHHIVRIRLMSQHGTPEAPLWRDHGHALPDGLCPGSREWAGSALYDPATGGVTLFYTAAGYRGEDTVSFAQRLFQTRGHVQASGDDFAITGWSTPQESFASDDAHYMLVNQREGAPGQIKGFRDPAYFRDPADGQVYLLFTGSLKASTHSHNACVGIARATDTSLESWELLPPIISADGLNNEQERPIMLRRDGRYYVLWSTQSKVFAPDGPAGPTGLYGMVGTSPLGPFAPLNGTGLVAANPPEAPYQTYSWWVDADLRVWGFVDYYGVAQKVDDAGWRRANFGGTPAPAFQLVLAGDTAGVAA